MALIIPYGVGESGSVDYEELDVGNYFESDYGTVVAKLFRYGRTSFVYMI